MHFRTLSWPIQVVFLGHDVLTYCSAPNGAISIPIEVLDSWLQCAYDNIKFIYLLSIFMEDLYVFVHFWTLKNHVLANYLAPNGPISILIEVLDF